jgi:predicted acyl esterase
MAASTRVEFLTVDGVTLRGDLYLPNSATASAAGVPIVVMTQGVGYANINM